MPLRYPALKRAMPAALLVLVVYFAFFYRLGDLALIGSDEPRYAQVAREMLARWDFVTPYLDNRPWLEKPPLYYWLAASAYVIYGPSEFSARLPSALSAALTVTLVYLFGCKIFSQRAGYLAALMLATSAEYFAFARSASTDMPLASTLTASLMLAYLGARERGVRSRLFLSLAYVCLGLSALAKGLVGPMLFALILVAFVAASRNYEVIVRARPLFGLTIFLACAAPWYVAATVRHKFDFLSTFFLNHHLARFFTPIHHHEEPFYYFALVLVVGFLPWSAYLPQMISMLCGGCLGSNGERDKLLYLLFWVVIPLAFFSLSSSKLPGYILPVFPALALICARAWDRYLDGSDGRSAKVSGIAAIAATASLAALLPFMLMRELNAKLNHALAFSLLAFTACLALLLFRIKWLKRAELTTQVALAVAIIVASYNLLAPRIEERFSTKMLAHVLTEYARDDKPVLTFRFFDHGLQYYASDVKLNNVESLQALKELLGSEHEGRLCLTETWSMDEISRDSEIEHQILFAQGIRLLLRVSLKSSQARNTALCLKGH